MGDLIEIPNVPTIEQIERLERECANHPDRVAVTDLPVFHHFTPGLYAREYHQPAGVVAVGEKHLTHHMIMLVAGEVTIWTEDGMKRITAPCLMETKPGNKRVVYSHEYSVFMSYHVTNETDPEVIRAQITEPSDNLLGLEHGCQFIEGGKP